MNDNTELEPQKRDLGEAGLIQMGQRGLELRSLDDAYRFAQYVVSAKLAPSGMNAAACLVAIQMGAEVGLPPMGSIQNIAVINGRPAIWGDAALAVCMQHPAFDDIEEYFENEGDPAKITAVCEVKKRGRDKPVIRRFSAADRATANLAGVHKSYPKRMLQMRARSWALKDAFPGALKGMDFAEIEEEIPKTVRAVENEAEQDPLEQALTRPATATPVAATPIDPEKPKRAARKPAAPAPEPEPEPEPQRSVVEDPEATFFEPNEEDDDPPFGTEDEPEQEQQYSLPDVYAKAKERKLKGSQFYSMVEKVSGRRTTKPEDLTQEEINLLAKSIEDLQ